jgi:hypothetical protein
MPSPQAKLDAINRQSQFLPDQGAFSSFREQSSYYTPKPIINPMQGLPTPEPFVDRNPLQPETNPLPKIQKSPYSSFPPKATDAMGDMWQK